MKGVCANVHICMHVYMYTCDK